MKKEVKSNFVNELGNKISINIRQVKDNIILVMKGPKSISENIITKKEAKELFKSLKTFFNSNK